MFQPFDQITNIHRPQRDTSFIQNDIIQNTTGINKSSSSTTIKPVAAFPPKGNQTPPLVSSSDIAPIRISTPTNDDMSSIADGDLNCSEEDELAAYDAQQANEHGEKIIVFRKRIRQVNFYLLKFFCFEINSFNLVIIKISIRFMVNKYS